MENYSKGKNVEAPLTRETIPISNLPLKFSWMQVSGGSKMRNLLAFADKSLQEEGALVWTGSGGALQKAISCAEIIKRKYPLHQINKLCYRKIEEHWEPKIEGLDELVVTREIPTIHILLSKSELDKDEPGYQPPVGKDIAANPGKTRNKDHRGPKKFRSTKRTHTQMQQ